MKVNIFKTHRVLGFFGSVFTAVFFLFLFRRASNSRNWSLDQSVLPTITWKDDDTVSISNIRNFSYQTTEEYTPGYYDRTYNVNTLLRVWYVNEPFPGFPGAAHTFVSFEFANNTFLSISVEIRREVGEEFSPFGGLVREFELVYVLADETDLIKLRTNYRNDPVYLYPLTLTPQQSQELFRSMLRRANAIQKNPEFYHTLTNACMTNIIDHLNEIRPENKITFDWRSIFPKFSDQFLYEHGLFDTELSFKEAHKKFYITKKAQALDPGENFSSAIRRFDT